WVWALRAVARAAGKDPAAVPAHPKFLRKVFAQAAPASIGLSRAGWNNARSLTGKVLAWAGLVTVPGHYLAPFAAEWGGLWALLPRDNNALRKPLSRFFHYCSAQRIPPETVTDAVLKAFHDALVVESIVDQPYLLYRNTATAWNDAVDRIA